MADIVPRDDNFRAAYGYDYDEGVNKVALLVYNPSTLEWERMRQPVLEVTDSNFYLALDTVEAKLQTLIDQTSDLESDLAKVAAAIVTEGAEPSPIKGVQLMAINASDYTVGALTKTANGLLVDMWGTYTEGAEDASITGVPALWEDTGNILRPVSAAKPLPVSAATLPTGTNTIGAVNVKPTTTGGLTIFRSIDLDETEEEVKASAGQLYGWHIFNAAATTQYVKLYNATAANVIVGTTTPVMTIPVPAGSAANVEFTNGIAFATAITAAATTGVADADTGAPAANSVVVNLLYA